MDDAKTVWVGNLHEEVTEELLEELFLQAGPLERVAVPKDGSGKRKNFGFVTFKHDVSVRYAVSLFEGIQLFGWPLNIKPRQGVNRSLSYPEEEIGHQQQRRMNDHIDMSHHHSFDNLLQMGSRINVNNDQHGRHYDNRERSRDRYRGRRGGFDRSLDDYEQDIEIEPEYERNRNHHHNRNHAKRGNYNRGNKGKRHYQRY